MSLRPYRDDVHDYIRRMERMIIASLGPSGIEAGPIEGLTGVWTPDRRKIASIGVHVSRGVTTHGFAINVNNDLQPFEWIVPCGIDHCQMSSVARELRRGALDMDAFIDIVASEFGSHLRAGGRSPGRARSSLPPVLTVARMSERAAAARHSLPCPARRW